MTDLHNVYISSNPDRTKLGKSKYGYVNGNKQNLANRITDSREQFSDLGEFTHIWCFEKMDRYNDNYNLIDGLISYGCRDIEIINDLEQEYDTILPNMRELSNYVVEGTNHYNEFVKNEGIPILLRALKDDFPKLGLLLIKKYSPEEIAEINKMGREKVKKEYEKAKNKYKKMMKLHKLSRTNFTSKWDERQYQRDIIELGINNLREFHRFYLELATGGGKSYIVYKLLNLIQSDTIIIFSPRKKINNQNGNNKYLSILSDNYHTFNYSNDYNLDDWLSSHKEKKKIIIACTQSQEKIYHSIIENNLSNISIWFDEAHWGIESWIDSIDNRSKQFFIHNTDKIKNRIFTSASPDKDKVESHPDIFGRLYCPITVKELIGLKWLCPINPRILEYNTESVNLSNWIIEEFSRTRSHYGFSFHNRDDNAFNLFYQHYQMYKDNNTTIKPYLLIDNGGLSDENKKRLETIHLDYDFRKDDDFEENENSIGYVCKKYDMGYDFDKLDYLVFSDPKMSRQDIIQCIGRGTRTDGFGENGRNLHKILNVMLPVYIGEDEGSYKNIIDVLRYLVLDLDIDILDEFIHNGGSASLTDKTAKGVDYNGDNNRSIIMDLLYQRNILERPTTKILYRFCSKYKIETEEEYNRFKLENPSIPLKDNIYQYNGFKWQNVLDPNSEIYYSEKSEIDKAEEQIVTQIEDEEKLEEFYAEREENGWIVLNRYDQKIPPMKIGQLEHYY